MIVGCLKSLRISHQTRTSLQRESRVSTKTRNSRPKGKQRLQTRVWVNFASHASLNNFTYHFQCGSG